MNDVWELLFKIVGFEVGGLPAATIIGIALVAIGAAGLRYFGRPRGGHRK